MSGTEFIENAIQEMHKNGPIIQIKRCHICGRFIRKKNPRRPLPGNPEKKYHGHSGSNHSKDDAQ